MRIPNFFKGISLVAGAVVVSLALCFVILAWSEPGQTPPGGNVAAPINTSGNLQTKSGDLKINTGLKISSDGTAFALKKDDGTINFVVGQDGNAGIGIAAPGQKLEVAGGNVKADGLCIGNDCRTKWTAGTCPAGECMKSIDASGNVACGAAGGSCPASEVDVNTCRIYAAYEGVNYKSYRSCSGGGVVKYPVGGAGGWICCLNASDCVHNCDPTNPNCSYAVSCVSQGCVKSEFNDVDMAEPIALPVNSYYICQAGSWVKMPGKDCQQSGEGCVLDNACCSGMACINNICQ